MTTTNLAGLFRAVVEDPDSDAPRHAYAAACAAAGDHVRAQFIELQIEASLRRRAGDPGASAPSGSARALLNLNNNFSDWADAIDGLVAWYGFFRGFVEKVSIGARQFLDQADDLYKLAPIRRLNLTGVPAHAAELFSSPHLARILSLSFDDEIIGDRELELVASSPHLQRLASLDVSRSTVTLAGVEALAASKGLPALTRLDLSLTPATRLPGETQDRPDSTLPRQSVDDIERRFGPRIWLHPVQVVRHEEWDPWGGNQSEGPGVFEEVL